MRSRRLASRTLLLATAFFALVQTSDAQAQVEPDLERPDDTTVEVDSDYRLRFLRIEPLELNGDEVRKMQWAEQRYRLDARAKAEGIGQIRFQADALDGVLMGDNGQFGGSPSSNSGVSLATKLPNVTTWEVGLPEGRDPLNPDSYVPVLVEKDPIEINYLYGEIFLPIGLLRIGRQPVRVGAGITAHDGARRNRWGVSEFSDTADRILFGTKLDEAIKIAVDPTREPDLSLDRGLIFGLFYDFMKQDQPQYTGDDLRQMGVAFDWRLKDVEFLGFMWDRINLATNIVYLNNAEFDTDIFGFPTNLGFEVGDLVLEAQYMHINGRTSEIAEGFAALGSGGTERQRIIAHGARIQADYTIGPATFTIELDYASGDDDPRTSNPITSFSFARDLNVGLLMFEHILRFESARSVAVGVENLSSLDVESFPLTEVQTEGRFTNAMAIFPQVYIDLLNTAINRVHTRIGVLMAWAAADRGVVDPILTTLAVDGNEISDDIVNFHGGRGGSFYGTEIDLQLGWKYKEHFEWIVEGAYLFPGSGFEDENGDAVNSYLFENRFVFLF